VLTHSLPPCIRNDADGGCVGISESETRRLPSLIKAERFRADGDARAEGVTAALLKPEGDGVVGLVFRGDELLVCGV